MSETENKKSLVDRIFPYWFYPMFFLGLIGSIWIVYAMLSMAWVIFKEVFYWLAAR